MHHGPGGWTLMSLHSEELYELRTWGPFILSVEPEIHKSGAHMDTAGPVMRPRKLCPS